MAVCPLSEVRHVCLDYQATEAASWHQGNDAGLCPVPHAQCHPL